MMSDKLIKHIAENRAKELFTKEFFETCTDSWYYDEFFEFIGEEVGSIGRKPSENEAYKYMGYLQDLKDKYEDDLFTSENAITYYKSVINRLHDIIDIIEEGKKKSKAFECSSDTTLKLKQIGNFFVDKYNEEYSVLNKKSK